MLRTHTVNQIYELKEGLETSLGPHSEAAMLTDSARYRAALTSAATALETLGNQYYSFDLAASLAITHRDYAQALSLHSSQSAIEIACSQLNSHWAGQVGAFGYAYGSERATELALEAHYLSVSSTALLAQEYSSRLAFENIGAATALPLADFEDIATQFSGLVDVYGQLLRSYQNEPCFIASLPPVASDGPPSELLENVILMDTLSTESPSQDIEESIGIHRQQHVWDEPTTDMLRALNPAFESAYIGALQALHSSNVDRARHVIVSLRELVTHILQHLAPDALVMVWSQDANHIHDGRPTRAARLYYICRAINGGAFADFVQADVRSTLACIELYQKGTHKIEPSFTDAQLAAIVTRTECLLRFLIITSRTAV